jgi:hypothetical protein
MKLPESMSNQDSKIVGADRFGRRCASVIGCFASQDEDQAAVTSGVQAKACCYGCGLVPGRTRGNEQRKTGWMRAEAARDPGPWRRRAILGHRWNATGESFADEAMQRERPQKGDSEAVSDCRNVGLTPLAAPDGDQSLRSRAGVQDPEASFDDIHRRDAERTTLSGHGDSSNLARIDQITTQIQFHGEQVEINVINKPKPGGRRRKLSSRRNVAQEGRRVLRGRPCLRTRLRSAKVWDPTIPRGPDPALDATHSDRLIADHCPAGPKLL